MYFNRETVVSQDSQSTSTTVSGTEGETLAFAAALGTVLVAIGWGVGFLFRGRKKRIETGEKTSSLQETAAQPASQAVSEGDADNVVPLRSK